MNQIQESKVLMENIAMKVEDLKSEDALKVSLFAIDLIQNLSHFDQADKKFSKEIAQIYSAKGMTAEAAETLEKIKYDDNDNNI